MADEVMMDNWDDQLGRLKLMADNDMGWDLSDNDKAAIRAALARLAAVEAERNRAMAGIENMERIRVGLTAERDAARKEVDRARWCEEMRADVEFSLRRWHVSWASGSNYHAVSDPDRSAAIDAARGGGR